MSVRTCHTLMIIFVACMCIGMARLGWYLMMQ